jgi:3-dehydroquinate synthetase/shikimate kinase
LDTPLDRHIVLIGFMGAGKSTLGQQVSDVLGRSFADIDDQIERAVGSIPDFFERHGQRKFRELETSFIAGSLADPDPNVIAVGGGAVERPAVRRMLGERAFTVLVDVDVDTAWQRVRGSDRPLAQDETEFRKLYAKRARLYDRTANAVVRDVHDIVLAAAGISVEPGSFAGLADLIDGPAEVVTDPVVHELHPSPLEAPTHVVPQGEEAKRVAVADRLWRELRLDRGGTLVAIGGGSVTDIGGFVAATHLRGIDWVAVPTTLVGQVDAAIGGKTAVNLPEGKNLVGAFHWPKHVLIDPDLLDTLPERQLLDGMAEAVKTGLLAGEALWELPRNEIVRRCAAFKTTICHWDPLDRNYRQTLNLGHTFAHALEAGSNGAVTHGEAVALGLLAALRLSGRPTDVVEEVLAPKPVRADRDRAWQALMRDKKGLLKLVLLGDEGGYVAPVPEAEVRRALDELIAD